MDAAADPIAPRSAPRRWEGEDLLPLAQAAALAGLLWPGRAAWSLARGTRAVGAGGVVVGALLAITAAREHGRYLTPRVRPPAGAELLAGGPYRFSRHPIYGGLLLASASFALLRRRPEPLVAVAGLACVLWVKTAREEARLTQRFGEAYEAYRARTPRLLGLPPRRAGA